jgi:hypothetical protein
MHYLNLMYSPLKLARDLELSKKQQWLVTAGAVTLAGAPFTPFCHVFEEALVDLLPNHPVAAGSLMLGQFGMSLLLIRFLFTNALNSRRFHATAPLQAPLKKKKLDN